MSPKYKTHMIPITDLEALLSYDPILGVLRWNERDEGFYYTSHIKRWNAAYAGKVAGARMKSGYLRVTINGHYFSAHRLAWALHHGAWPNMDIDHINGRKSDNRICNLRAVSHLQNMRNVSLKKNNSSGVNGVSWDKKTQKWSARIGVRGSTKYIGQYADFEAAVEARRTAEIKMGYHCNHGRIRRDNTVAGVLVTVEAI